MTNSNLRDRAAQAAGKPGTDVAVPAAPDREVVLHDWIKSQQSVIAGALPSHMTPEKLLRLVSVQVRQNPQLGYCTPESLLGAIMTSVQFGLEPGPAGHCWLIPRRNRKNHNKLEVVWQLGYKGVIELASRSGRVTAPIARTVYDGDDFDWQYGIDEKLRHVPSPTNDRTRPVYWYAIAKDTTTGHPSFVVIDQRDVEAARKRSSSPDSPAWRDDYDQMGNKTAVMRLRHWLPQSPELAQAVMLDDRVRHDVRSGVMDLAAHDVIELGPEDYTETDDAPPATSGDEPTDAAARVDEDTLRRLNTALSKAGHTKRAERLAFVSDAAGEPIESTNDLTPEQAQWVLDKLARDTPGEPATSEPAAEPDTLPDPPADDERARLAVAIGKAAKANGLTMDEIKARMRQDYRADLDTADLADLSSLLESLTTPDPQP